MTHRHGTPERRRELYRDAVSVIMRDYASDLQIDDVAAHVASSRRQLQRVFAEIGGTSFRELLAKVRMHEARRLLELDGIAIQDVAARVGYHEPAQFSKRFRRHFGLSPRAYRKAGTRPVAVLGQRETRPSVLSARAHGQLRPRQVDECPM